ncbi:hypothetical protein [Lyticum sinuosum]|uniref:Thioredoxin-like fold domain-containing protein n=1 Tax=Lyticum sinuosum TaxID=1332059 RepID=A0AAE4VLG1_9RICK|nr:hypothetical protein [Lyticum sinuosum]MDZ5761422.1 hypothetical protein [Lyticum sinuosum]
MHSKKNFFENFFKYSNLYARENGEITLFEYSSNRNLYADEVFFVGENNNILSLSDLDSKKALILLWVTWNIESIDAIKKLDKLALDAKRNNIKEIDIFPIMVTKSEEEFVKSIREINEIYNLNIIRNLNKYADIQGKLQTYFETYNLPILIVWNGSKNFFILDLQKIDINNISIIDFFEDFK